MSQDDIETVREALTRWVFDSQNANDPEVQHNYAALDRIIARLQAAEEEREQAAPSCQKLGCQAHALMPEIAALEAELDRLRRLIETITSHDFRMEMEGDWSRMVAWIRLQARAALTSSTQEESPAPQTKD